MRCSKLMICAIFMLSSCGYQLIRNDLASDIRFDVPTASNNSDFWGIESELTQSVRQQLHNLIGAQLGAQHSDYELKLSIDKVRRSARVWSRDGGVNMGLASLNVKYQLFRTVDNEEVLSNTISRSQEFLLSFGESSTNAFSTAIADITQQIVLEIAEYLPTS